MKEMPQRVERGGIKRQVSADLTLGELGKVVSLSLLDGEESCRETSLKVENTFTYVFVEQVKK